MTHPNPGTRREKFLINIQSQEVQPNRLLHGIFSHQNSAPGKNMLHPKRWTPVVSTNAGPHFIAEFHVNGDNDKVSQGLMLLRSDESI